MVDCRSDFPIFDTHPDLIYLDSAATTQKPRPVIAAVSQWYAKECAPVHRGMYTLAEAATAGYEAARRTVADFIHAKSEKEIVFTKNTTEAINLVAGSIDAWLSSGKTISIAGERIDPWKEGDSILLSLAEHHSNILPWRQLAAKHKLNLEYVRLTETGELDRGDLASKVSQRTRLVALSLCSNVLGSVTSMDEVTPLLSRQGSRPWVVLDAAQAIPHFPVDVIQLQADFLAFSAHKMYGPSGCGVLFARLPFLEAIPPYQRGGNMISQVTMSDESWAPPPHKFEAGTPNCEGVIGLQAAISYLESLGGMEEIARHTAEIATYLRLKLSQLPSLTVLGQPNPRSGIVSFTCEGVHPHDLASLLSQEGVAIRAGHHCTGPLHQWLRIPASNRASLGVYSTIADIDRFAEALTQVIPIATR
jgi:cysteine desulfurase/selenocysteine lyase